MIMYKAEKIENGVRVYKNNQFYLELITEIHTDLDLFVQDFEEFFDILEEVDEQTLEKLLSCYNAYFKGKRYYKNQVGDYFKQNEGQLSLW